MADELKPIDGLKPVAATNTDFYTAPGGVTDATVVTLRIANVAGTGGTADTVRVHKVPTGGSIGVDNAIMYDTEVAVGDTITLEKEILAPGDKISVRSANGDVTFVGSVLERTA